MTLPISVLKLQGTYREHRHGGVPEPDNTEDVQFTAWTQAGAREYFDYLKELVKGIGCDSSTYSVALSQLAEALLERNKLLAKAKESGGEVLIRKTGDLYPNPYYKMFMDTDRKILEMVSAFGLTPVAIRRLRQDPKKKVETKNAFEDLLKQ